MERIMAKGQIKSNKETKKPKKSKEAPAPAGGFMNAGKPSVPPKK
jgi:hypothetical protein